RRDRVDIGSAQVETQAHLLALELRAFAVPPSKRNVELIHWGLQEAVLLFVPREHPIDLVHELCHDVGLILVVRIIVSWHPVIQPQWPPRGAKLHRVEYTVGSRRDISDPVLA